jgi:hypothetical protein
MNRAINNFMHNLSDDSIAKNYCKPTVYITGFHFSAKHSFSTLKKQPKTRPKHEKAARMSISMGEGGYLFAAKIALKTKLAK